jgi:membrane-associated phospholipid phosphatase
LLLGPAWLLDKPLAQTFAKKPRFSAIKETRDALRQFGEPMAILVLSLVIGAIDRSRRRPLVFAFVVVLASGAVGSGVKLLVGRERPRVANFETVLRGPQWPGAMHPDASFPSGHTIAAFAFAYGMSQMYPEHRLLFFVLAAGSGLSRFFARVHFPTDVLAGAWIGYETAALIWRRGFLGVLFWLDSKVLALSWFPRWDWKTPWAPQGRDPCRQVQGGP